jgi:hypothetical protein
MKKIIFTAIAIFGLATITMAQVPNYVPTNGLVGWWPFTGNANDMEVLMEDISLILHLLQINGIT